MNEKQFEQYLQTFDTKPSPALRRKIFGTQNYWLPIGVAALFTFTFCATWWIVFTQPPANPKIVTTEPVHIQKTRLSYMRHQVIASGDFAAFVQKDTADSSHQVYTASSRNLADFNNN